ncbi:hypothetical protein [Sodalis sp.]|uniref:hypothetical protein n=1 Tax=Sodalis sp. (in: enterobacteria) TaxID=1898979 RepID=UPI00387361FA
MRQVEDVTPRRLCGFPLVGLQRHQFHDGVTFGAVVVSCRPGGFAARLLGPLVAGL